ncbi:MAG: hypothetical protein NTZ10_02395 [Candidatus Saganbacteria bacterium]|nr:hypothetical protein [Candidatus Saganbacteria bacterium]
MAIDPVNFRIKNNQEYADSPVFKDLKNQFEQVINNLKAHHEWDGVMVPKNKDTNKTI